MPDKKYTDFCVEVIKYKKYLPLALTLVQVDKNTCTWAFLVSGTSIEIDINSYQKKINTRVQFLLKAVRIRNS